MTNIIALIAVGSGGALGAIGRYLLSGAINRHFPSQIALGTLAVNLLGSLAMGLLLGMYAQGYLQSNTLKLFLLSGFLGALTTYSTFAIESYMLLDKGNLGPFLLSIGANLIGSILFAAIGYILIAK